MNRFDDPNWTWDREMRPMTSARVGARVFARALPLALAAATGCAVVAHAQSLPWPASTPQPSASAPWPTQQQPGMNQPAPATLPMPMPQSQPAMQSPGMSMGGPGPSPEQQKCVQEFQQYRQEVEKRARTAEAETKKKPTREKMCELVGLYSTAEFKWIRFSEANMAKCGIPKQAIEQIKAVHAHTVETKKRLCAAGPAQAAPAAPSLSEALGASLQPNTDEPSKRKVGGTMDTLTGNVLTR
jgi:hypothetical protein